MKKLFKELIQEFLGERKLTARELWALVKICKHVRLRCRNNAAFNNAFNSAFPYATFRQVNKTRADGSTYPGLQITVEGQTAGNDEDEE